MHRHRDVVRVAEALAAAAMVAVACIVLRAGGADFEAPVDDVHLDALFILGAAKRDDAADRGAWIRVNELD